MERSEQEEYIKWREREMIEIRKEIKINEEIDENTEDLNQSKHLKHQIKTSNQNRRKKIKQPINQQSSRGRKQTQADASRRKHQADESEDSLRILVSGNAWQVPRRAPFPCKYPRRFETVITVTSPLMTD